MKTSPSLLSLAAIALLGLSGIAHAEDEAPAFLPTGNTEGGQAVTLAPSYGSPMPVLLADSTRVLKLNADGSVEPRTLHAERDQIIALRIVNSSSQAADVTIAGHGADTVALGQAEAGKPAEFGWRFDSWRAVPTSLRVGDATVSVYVEPVNRSH